jgi:hypothetical protein
MLLSAVSILVVAQSSSEIPEGLMNNPVYSTELEIRLSFDKTSEFLVGVESPKPLSVRHWRQVHVSYQTKEMQASTKLDTDKERCHAVRMAHHEKPKYSIISTGHG